eukprot:473580-Rhodomonas_salina.2
MFFEGGAEAVAGRCDNVVTANLLWAVGRSELLGEAAVEAVLRCAVADTIADNVAHTVAIP